jgi:hypothetical protein
VAGVGALLAATPAAAQYEPNDHIGQATGPLLGGTAYGGAIETSNDEDWFYFYTAGQAQLDIAATSFGPGGIDAILYDANGEHLDEKVATENATAHIYYSAPGPGRYYVLIADYDFLRPSYQLRIDPADALTSTPPAPPTPPAAPGTQAPAVSPRACRKARTRHARAARSLRDARRKLRSVRHRPIARRRWRQIVRKRKSRVRALRRTVRVHCA